MKRRRKKIVGIFNRYLTRLKIPFDSVFALIGLILLSVFLIRNIYLNIDIWLTNYQLKAEMESQVSEVETENQRLKKAVEYYKSTFYQQKYARESLNLAKPNQQLYYVERKQEYDYLQEAPTNQRIELKNNREWWIKLIL